MPLKLKEIGLLQSSSVISVFMSRAKQYCKRLTTTKLFFRENGLFIAPCGAGVIGEEYRQAERPSTIGCRTVKKVE